jgi:predicted metalloendopeptidase
LLKIDWKKLLDQVFSSSGVAVNTDEQLNVAGLTYLLNVLPILKAAPQKVVADYIGLRVASGVASSTTEAMRAILFKFTQALTGAKEPATRCKRNLKLIYQ